MLMLVTKVHQGSDVLLCMWHLFTRGVGCHNTCHNSCHNITLGHTEALLQNDSHTHNCNGVNRQKELFAFLLIENVIHKHMTLKEL